MKKITMVGLIMLMSISAAMLNGCKKPEKGDKGDPGTPGADGNANVSCQISVVSSWNYTSPKYFTNIYDPDITSDIVNYGAVLVYIQTSAGAYSQLPVTVYPTTSYSGTFEVVTFLNTAQIQFTYSDFGTGAPAGTIVKIITIASRSMLSNPDINWKDFNSVKAAFNLK